jgi:hypothetical protein
MKRAILTASLIVASPAAIAQDRAAALPSLQKICQNDILSSRSNLAALAILRISLHDFCDYASTQMVSEFSTTDVTMYSRSGQLPVNFKVILIDASQFCKAHLCGLGNTTKHEDFLLVLRRGDPRPSKDFAKAFPAD